MSDRGSAADHELEQIETDPFPEDSTEEATGEAFDLHNLTLLLGLPQASSRPILHDYVDEVANIGLLPYKTTIHYATTTGGKAGESLYTHILNGIFVLEQLRVLLELSDDETHVLFTAYTIHDINKMVDQEGSYAEIATSEQIAKKIVETRLDCFFPGYDAYLNDIQVLARLHPGHKADGAEFYDLRRQAHYRLGNRLEALVELIRAADVIDLSHTLEEQPHKTAFLDHINRVSRTQYTFVQHSVSEQRGTLTNLLHNAVIEEFHQRFGLEALLIYPEGAAYLCPRGSVPTLNAEVITAIAKRVANTINQMTSIGFAQFIRPIN